MMVDPKLNDRLSALEARLAALEKIVSPAEPPSSTHEPVLQPPGEVPPTIEGSPPLAEAPLSTGSTWLPAVSASTILGWAGAAALLLAAAYFVRLAIAEGWLTPWLQVGIAAVAGIVMIGGGVA